MEISIDEAVAMSIERNPEVDTARQNYLTAQYDYVRYKAAVENEMGLNGYELEE